MFKNYFYLNRLVVELNPLLQNSSLFEAYSQEKDKIILSFSKESNNIAHLILSVSQNEPFILQKKDYHRAKRNTVGFFEDFLPQKLINIEIATDDRIIRFNFEDFSLFFIIMGKDSNVIMLNNLGSYESFRRIKPEQETKVIGNINNKQYSCYFHKPYLDEMGPILDFKTTIKGKFPFISKEILSEVYARTENINDSEELRNHLAEVIDEIECIGISVFYDTQLNKVIFAPSTFRIFSPQDIKQYNDYQTALNEYLISKYRFEKIINIKGRISKYLQQQIEKVAQKLNQIKFKLESPSKEELFRNCGNLLLANITSVRKGMKEIVLEDFYTNQPVMVKLNVTLDPRKNVDAYFEKAKNEKQSRIYLRELFNGLMEKYNSLLEIKARFETAIKMDEYLTIMEKLNLSDDAQSNNPHHEKEFNFKHYIVENKYHVYVGKDSHNNDLLTVKFAKQNDYWFHARGVPGSHVVLRVENSKEAVPKSVLKKTASIAAFHSKAKTSKMAPVAFTLKKYVSKKKGMEPGKVSLQREDVLLVPPEIPTGCEFQSD